MKLKNENVEFEILFQEKQISKIYLKPPKYLT